MPQATALEIAGVGAGAVAIFKGGDGAITTTMQTFSAFPASMSALSLSSRGAKLTREAKLASASTLALGATAVPIVGTFATGLSLSLLAGRTLSEFVELPEKNVSAAMAAVGAATLCLIPLPGSVTLQMLGAAAFGGVVATEAVITHLQNNWLNTIGRIEAALAAVDEVVTPAVTRAVLLVNQTVDVTLAVTRTVCSTALLAAKNATSIALRTAAQASRWARPKLAAVLRQVCKPIDRVAPGLASNVTRITHGLIEPALETSCLMVKAALRMVQSLPVERAVAEASQLTAASVAASRMLVLSLKQNARVVAPWVLAAVGVAMQQ